MPIPGTTKLHRLEENLGALDLAFTEEDVSQISEQASKIQVKGNRLPEAILKVLGC